jgi:hypothetical protein
MYEVHITINPIEDSEIERFISFCGSIAAKPILIELPKGQVVQQPMISKVFKSLKEGELNNQISILKSQFSNHSYDIARTKVEVPLEFINRGRREFPNYHGQYFEWHGKVEYEEIEQLKKSIRHLDAHISNNALKDNPKRRFVTVRGYQNKRFFLNKIDSTKKAIQREGLRLVKEEYEYCIYDSNKLTDSGWIDTAEITDENYLNLLAFEGFLRRAVDKEEKFILKGSLLTRQYLKEKRTRAALDLDFIYGDFIDNDGDVEGIFTNWVTKVTETEVKDNIKYRSFKENKFWRSIDYAMHDDFPTTNTDLSCLINESEIPVVGLDISWNLLLQENPIPLLYEPIEGDAFVIAYSVPLATQIAWKLHQSIVRPRAKDLIDIILILESNKLTKKQIETIGKVFASECSKDKIDHLRLNYYTEGKVSEFLIKRKNDLDESYNGYWSLNTPFGFEVTTPMKLIFLDGIFKVDFEFDDVQGMTKKFETCLVESGIGLEISKIESNLSEKKIIEGHGIKRKDFESRGNSGFLEILKNIFKNKKTN